MRVIMNFKKVLLLLSFIVIFASIIGVSASSYQHDMNDYIYVLNNFNESELTGCCSVMLQIDENHSMMSFRRDASYPADIYIEEIDWHGHKAIKQYKENGGYFCQVIITQEGWMLGFGGSDDGDDNKRIENLSAGMINENNTISEDILKEIQGIKASYGIGHFLIKAPNGNYGAVTASSYNVGKLKAGEYYSLPNWPQFTRSGTFNSNSSDKVSAMISLTMSDAFGVTRRDITTFDYYHFENDTFKANITDMYLSNDDGSVFGSGTASLVDSVYFNNTVFNASDIPMGPKYEKIGTVKFVPPEDPDEGGFNFGTIIASIGFIIFVLILAFAALQIIRFFKFKSRRRRRR